MLADKLDFVVGVDPHRDRHALAIVHAATGAAVSEVEVAASELGYAQALCLAEREAPGRRAWAIEGTGSFVVVEGLIRVTIFILYILVISLLPDLKRVFQYHAAEHKAINAYEAGDELEPATVQRYSLIHPRCGTAFLLWVMVIAIFVFAFFGRPVWYWLITSRILLLPLIAGIAYELIRFAGKHTDNRVLMTLLAPGLWLQRLTTREPTLDQLEVSISALKDVLKREGRLDPAERKVEVMA